MCPDCGNGHKRVTETKDRGKEMNIPWKKSQEKEVIKRKA